LGRILRYAEGIALGMQYLHSQGVIHRDLKSGNILLDGRDNIKGAQNPSACVHARLGADLAAFCAVADFGVARRLSSCSESMTAETGTYRWMAPEVIRHSRYDHRVDLYSFAIVLWEMLSGKLPYGDLSPIAAAAAVVVENLRPPLADAPDDTPAELMALMVQCWDVAPAVRPEFEAVAASVAALRAQVASSPTGSPVANSGSSRISLIAPGSSSGTGADGSSAEERAAPLPSSPSGLRPLSQLEPDEPVADGEALFTGSMADEAGHAAFPPRGTPQRRRTSGLLQMMGCCTQVAGNSM
jgi:serine/threonine protein kinase